MDFNLHKVGGLLVPVSLCRMPHGSHSERVQLLRPQEDVWGACLNLHAWLYGKKAVLMRHLVLSSLHEFMWWGFLLAGILCNLGATSLVCLVELEFFDIWSFGIVVDNCVHKGGVLQLPILLLELVQVCSSLFYFFLAKWTKERQNFKEELNQKAHLKEKWCHWRWVGPKVWYNLHAV